ncbi:MAG: response regulator transcription factor [Chloroflexi bacterium]|jgi:DNA-binding NarL/FixJ family response regulator|nr:response regulator transcription factor [Chloroflexota bacterium]
MSDKSTKTIRILIADDEPLARAGIRTVLSQVEDFEVVGEAQDGFEVQELVPKLLPKILLLDYRMPGPGAYNLEKWIRENYPETTVLVLTAHDRDAYLSETIDSGMAGFLLKNEKAERLIQSIRNIATGTPVFSEEQIERAQKWKRHVGTKWKSLSAREREVLQRLASGEDNKTIAELLTISVKTVEFHVTNILKKLNVTSREEAIVWMLEHQPDDPWITKDQGIP